MSREKTTCQPNVAITNEDIDNDKTMCQPDVTINDEGIGNDKTNTSSITCIIK